MTSSEVMSIKRTTRRTFLQYTGAAITALGLSQLGFKPNSPIENTPTQRPEKLGTSFSQVQCRHLKMSPQKTRETYLKVLDMGFDIVRIGAYMDEISERGFEFLDWQIEEAEKRGVDLILNVGIKVQRYPEFHPTKSIRDRLRFWEKSHQTIGEDDQTFQEVVSSTDNIIQRYKERPIIKYWQIENEPFDRLSFANNHIVAERLVDKQIEILKEKLPNSKLIMSEAIGLPDSEDNFRSTLKRKPDAIGLNIYYRVPKPLGGYYELTDQDFNKISAKGSAITGIDSEPMIMESQAEPWENGAPVHLKDIDYPSSNPDLAIKLASKLGSIGYKTVLLWGSEYWIYRANHGNTSWIEKISDFIKTKKAA